MIDLNDLRSRLPAAPAGHYFELEDECALGIHWWSLQLKRSRRWWFPETIDNVPVTGVLSPPHIEDLSDEELEQRIIGGAYDLLERAEERFRADEASARRAREVVPLRGRRRL